MSNKVNLNTRIEFYKKKSFMENFHAFCKGMDHQIKKLIVKLFVGYIVYSLKTLVPVFGTTPPGSFFDVHNLSIQFNISVEVQKA